VGDQERLARGKAPLIMTRGTIPARRMENEKADRLREKKQGGWHGPHQKSSVFGEGGTKYLEKQTERRRIGLKHQEPEETRDLWEKEGTGQRRSSYRRKKGAEVRRSRQEETLLNL